MALVGVHVEPLGIYSHRYTSLEALPTKATIAIPNDDKRGPCVALTTSSRIDCTAPRSGKYPNSLRHSENKGQIRFVELEAAS